MPCTQVQLIQPWLGLVALLQPSEHLGLSVNHRLEWDMFYVSPNLYLLVATWGIFFSWRMILVQQNKPNYAGTFKTFVCFKSAHTLSARTSHMAKLMHCRRVHTNLKNEIEMNKYLPNNLIHHCTTQKWKLLSQLPV